MDALTTLIHQFEGSIRKIDRSKSNNEITHDTYQALIYLIGAARTIALEERKKYPNGYLPPPKEEEIRITGMVIDE